MTDKQAGDWSWLIEHADRAEFRGRKHAIVPFELLRAVDAELTELRDEVATLREDLESVRQLARLLNPPERKGAS